MPLSGCASHVVASATDEFALCLGNIRLLAGMMLDESRTLDGDLQRDYLRTIERKASHLLDVAARLGDLAQLGTGPAPLQRCEFRLSEIAEQSIEALTPLAASHLRLLVLAVASREPMVSGDYRKLLQALSGLLRHCLSIAVPAAQILLTVRAGDETVRLEIDVPVDAAGPANHDSRGRQLSEVPVTDGDALATAVAAQVFEVHGGALRPLAGERHQRFVAELPIVAR